MRSNILIESSKGDHEKVKLLLIDSRVDPSADGNEAVQQATHKGHDKVVKLLLADPRVKNSTRLIINLKDFLIYIYEKI